MGILDFLGIRSRKPNAAIERSIQRFQLGTSAKTFEKDPQWQELTGPEKMMFYSGLADERLFSAASGAPCMCGFVNDRLYKIAMGVEASQADSYTTLFSQKYGRPSKPKSRTYLWEDDATSLEINVREPQANVMLTDKHLLGEAYRHGRG
jgi:hypothetical protein